jgi:hypothetical protein
VKENAARKVWKKALLLTLGLGNLFPLAYYDFGMFVAYPGSQLNIYKDIAILLLFGYPIFFIFLIGLVAIPGHFGIIPRGIIACYSVFLGAMYLAYTILNFNDITNLLVITIGAVPIFLGTLVLRREFLWKKSSRTNRRSGRKVR